MKNRSRLPSPPAAYAKYLNDFEECDEAPLDPPKKRQATERLSRNGVRNSLAKRTLSNEGVSEPVPSTSRLGVGYGYDYEKKSYGGRDSFADTSETLFQPYIASSLDLSNNANNYHSNSYRYSDTDVRQLKNDFPVYSEGLVSKEDSLCKKKFIYDVEEITKKKSKKICFAFAKFGDCHYGADCKFSHDPKYLKSGELVESRIEPEKEYNDVDNPDATCRQLEKRLLEIQRELTLLEEESKKPKSSVVVPKKNKSAFSSGSDNFGSNLKASINVGGDFIVRVGNTRREVEEYNRSDRNGDRFVDALRRDEPAKKLKRYDRRGYNSITERHSKNGFLKNRSYSPQYDDGKPERSFENEDLLKVSDDSSSGRGTPKAYASACNFATDWVSGSESDKSGKKSTTDSEMPAGLVSSPSEECFLSLSEESVFPAGDFVSDAEVQSSDDEKGSDAKPIDFSSVIAPESLIDISDDNIDESDSKPSTSRKPLSCRDATSLHFVFRNTQIIYERLPKEIAEKLRKYDVEDPVGYADEFLDDEVGKIFAEQDLAGYCRPNVLDQSVTDDTSSREEQLRQLSALADEATEIFMH